MTSHWIDLNFSLVKIPDVATGFLPISLTTPKAEQARTLDSVPTISILLCGILFKIWKKMQ